MPVPPLRLLAGVLSAALAATSLVGLAPTASAAEVRLSQLLADVPAGPQRDAATYDRDSFRYGNDGDGDGCDTRREVLIAESTVTPTIGPGCSVSGSWTSYYDGVTTDDAAQVEVDHVVALAEAWRSGASRWSGEQRRAHGNDLDLASALVAVTQTANRVKSDRDPSSWLPLESARCRYASEWVQVKYRWDLSADDAERGVLSSLARACGDPGVEVPTRAGTPAPAPRPDPGPVLATGSTMSAGQVLTPGAWLLSDDRTHGLAFQADGNLVAYGPRERALWSSGTYGNPGATFVLQPDGNAVVYARDGRALWDAGTYGNPGAGLTVQDDGNVVLYRGNGSAAWFTGWDRTSLFPGQSLTGGQQITSASGRYHLVLQRDGNVVTYRGGRPLFFSGSYGADRLTLQGDGNLVAYRGGRAVWDAGSWREGRLRLDVQDDGNAVLYRGNGAPAWYSAFDTGRAATSASRGTLLPYVPPAPPVPAPPAPVQPPSDMYDTNCDAVRAAGKAPLYRGQPGYRSGLDRDGDGKACE